MDTNEKGWCVSVSRKSQKSKSQKSPDGPSAVAPATVVTEDPVTKSEDEQRLDLVKGKIAELDAQRIEHEAQIASIQKKLAELCMVLGNYSDEETFLKKKIKRQEELQKFKTNPGVNPKSVLEPAPASHRPDPQEFPSLSEGRSFLKAINNAAPAPTPASPPAPTPDPTPKFHPGTVDFKRLLTTLAGMSGETVTHLALGEGHAFTFNFPYVSLTPDATKFVETLAAHRFTHKELTQYCKDAREILRDVITPIKPLMTFYSTIHLMAKDFAHSFVFRGIIKVTMEVYFTPPPPPKK
jgi:hypothetical protein